MTQDQVEEFQEVKVNSKISPIDLYVFFEEAVSVLKEIADMHGRDLPADLAQRFLNRVKIAMPDMGNMPDTIKELAVK